MYCRYKDAFRFYKLDKENAQEVLELLGYGKEKCKKTYEDDRRFGRIEYDYICFGFENRMNARYFFGNYIVFDDYLCNYPHRYLSEKEFLDEYEIIRPR